MSEESVGPEFLEGARALEAPFLTLLEELVTFESPTGDEDRSVLLAHCLEDHLASRGAVVQRHEAPGLGVHLSARLTSSVERSGGPLLIVGHMDTVHPAGTLDSMPFTVSDDVVRGPGVYDMKGGVCSTLIALDLLHRLGRGLGRDLHLLLTCDEEVGSNTSRSLIESCAEEAYATLVAEPCVPGGAAKTRRKGTGGFEVRVGGIAAHSGIEPERGASAISEMAHQILRIKEIERVEVGTTINVGVVSGGTKSNVVADSARATTDLRFWTREEAQRVEGEMAGLTPRDSRCSVTVEGGVNRYALERTPEAEDLFGRAASIASGLGLELTAGESGGASDGNLTSAVGCPTLDGLGLDGGGAHSSEEHIRRDDIAPRIALMAAWMAAL